MYLFVYNVFRSIFIIRLNAKIGLLRRNPDMKVRDQRKIRKKHRSKRGMSLAELVVGVAIIVIVFAATLTGLTTGYTTTVKNADLNKAAVKCASANEVISSAVANLNLVRTKNIGDITNQQKVNDSKIKSAAQVAYPGIVYVERPQFPKTTADPVTGQQLDAKWTYDMNTNDGMAKIRQADNSTKTIFGVLVETAVNSSNGYVYCRNVVPYAKQPS